MMQRHCRASQIVSALMLLAFTATNTHAVVGVQIRRASVPVTMEQRRPADYWWLNQMMMAANAEAERRVFTMAEGFTEGRISAEAKGTGGNFAGALAVGFFTGLIGTGIIWGLTGGDDPPAHMVSLYQGKGAEYTQAFVAGYKERTKQKKRGAALGGGVGA